MSRACYRKNKGIGDSQKHTNWKLELSCALFLYKRSDHLKKFEKKKFSFNFFSRRRTQQRVIVEKKYTNQYFIFILFIYLFIYEA